jgi:hypothetical protein
MIVFCENRKPGWHAFFHTRGLDTHAWAEMHKAIPLFKERGKKKRIHFKQKYTEIGLSIQSLHMCNQSVSRFSRTSI